MDEGLRHSRAERYVRDMDDSPDRWFYDGSTIYLIYGADVKSVPFDGETAGEMQVFASEDDDASDLYRYLNPNDQDSQPLEEEGIGSGYRLAISLIPSDYLIAEDLPAAISEVTNFMMYLVSEGNIDPSTVAVQMDTEFNEIDIVGIQDQDYEGMVEIHDALSQLMEEAPSNGYVYAIFTHPVIGMDFFPMNYGYPAGRRTMQQRMFQSEDVDSVQENLVLESAIVIEPTDSIVERVLAFNRALDASAMQQKLIEVQYAIKNGFATPREAFAMLLEG